jgi:mersacidin/lichenicidin family type 2 lantibiotic
MTHEQIVRAWKDEDYRHSMSGEELSALPENPAGLLELSDLELGHIAGQTITVCITIVTPLLTPSIDPTTYITNRYVCVE